MIRFFLFLFSILNCCKLVAQDSIVFEKFNFENNDLQSIVYSISDDIYGNLWFATEEGVVRYNSKETYLYDTNRGIPKNIGNRVFSIIKDNKGTIWIGSNSGIAYYNKKKDCFESTNVLSEKVDRTSALVCDDYNNIWIASDNGLWFCDQTKTVVNVLPNIKIFSIFYYKGLIYFTCKSGIYSFTFKDKRICKQRLSSTITNGTVLKIFNSTILVGTKEGRFFASSLLKINFEENFISKKILGSRIRDIEFNENKYYIATDGSGIFITNNTFRLENHIYFSDDKQNTITSNGVYDLYFTNDITWVSTYGGGVNYYSKSKQLFTNLKHKPNNLNSLANNTVRSILECNNKLWFGTKRGISIYDISSKKWNHLFKDQEEIILSLAQNDNFIFAASYTNGLYRIDKKSLKIEKYYDPKSNPKGVQNIFKVFIDNYQNLWLGGIDGELVVLKKNTVINYPIKDIRDIVNYKGKIITVGRNGVQVIDHLNRKIKSFARLNLMKKNLIFNTINAVYVNQDDIILGTNGAGLLFFNPTKNKLSKIDITNDLSSNIVQGIIKYNNSSFWISTTKGLSNLVITSKDTIVKNYNKTDGLSSNEFNYSAFLKSKNGNVVFGGIEGVTIFDPKSIKPRNILPKIIFEDFMINNEVVKDSTILPYHVNQTTEILLSHKQNSFGFKFIGVLQGYSSKVKYSYKLEGFDEFWSKPTFKNFANYTNLNPGQYIFRVKATNEHGDFCVERSIIVSVSRPWYTSYFAYFIYLLILLMALYFLIELIKIIEIKKNKEEQIDFFNNITHEIKTPLSILLSTVEQYNSEENLRVKSSIERINNLINQMLNFQRFSEDSIDVQISKINLNDFVNQLILDFKPLLEDKKLFVIFDNYYDKEIFYFSEEYLTKILFNLLSNSIKYSYENKNIIISLNKGGQSELSIKIKDFGVGIPKNDQKNILTKFFRAKNVVNNQFSGSGLGLMIVKRIVDKTGGVISFKSSNKGTTFKVNLPDLQKNYFNNSITKSDIAEIQITNEIKKFGDKKILIVEDNEDLKEYLLRTLENYFLVYVAQNGKEAYNLASNIYPDLILTDFMMPVMDGLSFSKKILSDINLNHIPIFMLTALHNTSHKTESTHIGIVEYIEKPISISLLLAKITSTFIRQEKLKEYFIQRNDFVIASKNKNDIENDFLSRLEKIILEKVKDDSFTLIDICNTIGMSRTSLYMKLKNLINLSPQDFIIHTKLKYAKTLLLDGNSNIKEIAYSSGFSNPKYFSTTFKKFFGITPTEYLKKINNNLPK